ncbi:MAG TPA: SPFH domain-containing protein, partial [Thermoanaerobaculia bacterium]
MIPTAVIAKAAERKREREETAVAAKAVKEGQQADRGTGGRRFANPVSATAAVIVFALMIFGMVFAPSEPVRVAIFIGGIALALLALFSIKIANQWEKAVVLRLGKFVGLRGPGFFAIIPIVEQISHLIDQRVRVTDVTAESALTR